ncbi:hypothetical protein ACIOGZ_28990 [Kitasatospora sp. NPDC088160]|uniref:hypothetical protein n=1 Tax=Kitasatospora sp. NPDC088160 TaxID=3364072 RepID=UPI00382502C6
MAATAVLPTLIRHQPLLLIAFDAQPVLIGLLLSALVVFWPALLGAAFLSIVADRLR